MEINFKIEGAQEIENSLKKLNVRIEKNINRRAVGAGAKVFIKAMKALVPTGDTGTLKRSIGMKRLKARKTATVIIGPRSGKARQARTGKTGKVIKSSDGWYAHLVEYGTFASRTHPLSPRAKRKPRKNGMPQGMRPRPFMRPAFDTQQEASIKAMADTYRAGIASGR